VHLAYALYTTPNERKARNVSSTRLPLRCLYVEPESKSANKGCRLVDTARRRGSYMTLSFVSEGRPSKTSSSPWMLTRETVERCKRGIEPRHLPVALRDAITVTRNLGISYLWINDLCVVQDSPEDVAEEFGHMADYYANSAAIIAERGESTSLQWRLTPYNDKIVDVAQYSIYGMPQILEGPSWSYIHLPLTNYDVPQNGQSSKEDSALSETEITDSEVVEVITSSAEVPSTSPSPSDSQISLISEAQQMLDKSRQLITQGSYIEATAFLILSRDLVGPLQAELNNAVDLHALATAMLGTAYHMLNLSSIALDILQSEIKLYLGLQASEESRSHV